MRGNTFTHIIVALAQVVENISNATQPGILSRHEEPRSLDFGQKNRPDNR